LRASLASAIKLAKENKPALIKTIPAIAQELRSSGFGGFDAEHHCGATMNARNHTAVISTGASAGLDTMSGRGQTDDSAGQHQNEKEGQRPEQQIPLWQHRWIHFGRIRPEHKLILH